MGGGADAARPGTGHAQRRPGGLVPPGVTTAVGEQSGQSPQVSVPSALYAPWHHLVTACVVGGKFCRFTVTGPEGWGTYATFLKRCRS